VAGAGINVAQRVMDCGDGGHILLTKRVAEDLAQSRRWTPCLHDLGECAVKHGVPIFLVNFYGEGFGNPESPKVMQHALAEQAARTAATGASRGFRTMYGALAAVMFFVTATALGVWLYSRQTPLASAHGDKSIAVLPFENFSPEKDNAFFADGIQDDILTSLAKIKELRVISRSSVMAFRDAAAQNLRDIGQKLGVANILEGSVRKQADRVVVNVQLIDAPSNRQIWANHYDRTLVDSLGLQGELASEIAETLRATLSEDEKARATNKPTQNADAYVFYLRANHISRNPDTLLEDYKTAEQLYMQAIELDPNFALAHARLASVCAEVFRYYEPTQSWKTKARSEAEAALRLQPNLAEGHFALGQCIYWMDQDYDKALEQFEIASRLSPSNADTRRLIAAIERRQGKWQAALEAYKQVAKLDPQNPSTARELMYTNSSMRRWPEAAHWAGQMRALAPTSLVAKIQSGYIHFQWKGDSHPLKSMLEEIPAGVDPDGSVTAARWDVAMLQRDFSAAKRILETSSANEISYSIAGLTPKIFLEGCTYVAQGDDAGAQKAFEQARPAFEAAVKEAPESAERHASLGWLYALMGRKNDAIAEGQRAVELKPESKDALDGSLMKGYLALIYARVGERDLAIPLIEHLLKTSGPVDSADYSITVNDLRYRWEWDPIRDDSHFKKLIAEPTP
jgi:TolB-like protein/Flp pilus assembly protein TadD